MAKEKELETQIFDISTNSDSNIILSYIREQYDSLAHTSKEKYSLKVKLIEETDEMSTKEKLDALDCNYDRYRHEVWQNISSFMGGCFIVAIGFKIVQTYKPHSY